MSEGTAEVEVEVAAPRSEARPRAGMGWWWLVPVLGLLELALHFLILSHVPGRDAWARAAAKVNKDWQPGDLVVSAPGWTDPLLRRGFGENLRLGDAGRASLEGYRRIWELSIRGARADETRGLVPELDMEVGGIRVRRYAHKTGTPLANLVDLLPTATVTRFDKQGREVACDLVRRTPEGGGLGEGPMKPAARFECDPRRRWLWVGATVIEDLHYAPRACIWQRVQGKDPVRVRIDDVPLGDRLALGAGLYHRHERGGKGTPIHFKVTVGDAAPSKFKHRDGEGWRNYDVAVPAELRGKRAPVTVDVWAKGAKDRGFCWSALSIAR